MLDLTEVKDDFEVMPPGFYPAYVDEVEIKDSSSGHQYINIKWKIFGEKFENAVVWEILNLFHGTEKVRNIAMSSLKKMLMASGFEEKSLKFETREKLLETMRQCRCQIKTAKFTDDFGTKAVVKGYKAFAESSALVPKVDPDDIPF